MITIKQGDITKEPVEAVVNAANAQLNPGAGVCGAIYAAAGPALDERLKGIRIATSQNVVTSSYKMNSAEWIIHAVGPVYSDNAQNNESLLFSTYWNVLRVCQQTLIESVAFPAISTGIYGFPLEKATEIALRAIYTFKKSNEYPKDIVLVCYDEKTLQVYKRLDLGMSK